MASPFNGSANSSLVFGTESRSFLSSDLAETGDEPSQQIEVLPVYFLDVSFAKITIHRFSFLSLVLRLFKKVFPRRLFHPLFPRSVPLQ